MGRHARIHFASLRSSLVNLPISLYGPLVERSVRPQQLAVHLSLVNPSGTSGKKVSAYVGWSGLAAASSLARFSGAGSNTDALETIELDPQFAQALGLALDDVVEVGLVHDMGRAETVSAEPVSPDDWEIIDLHSAHVETTLLSQARVAAVGQELALWVLGRTLVRMKVVSVSPASKTNALLLGTDTEVIVAPKSRAVTKATSSTTAAASQTATDPTTTSTETASAPVTTKRAIKTLRVIPSQSLTNGEGIPRVYVSRYTFSALTDCAPSDLIPEERTNGEEEASIEDQVHLHPCTITLLTPPVDPSNNNATTEPEATPRVLDLNGISAVQKGSNSDSSFMLACIPFVKGGIPNECIAVSNKDAAWTTGDIVRVVVERTKGGTEIAWEPRPTNQVKPVDDSGLAGVDKFLKQCANFFTRQFILHTMAGRAVSGFPALLLLGKSGAGKTSVAKAVTSELHARSGVYAHTQYVDCTKYAETPVATLKSLFKYWAATAAWYRPSILVLDNLDKMLPAEQEHAPSFRSRHLSALFLREFGTVALTGTRDARQLTILATAESSAALHPSLISAHLFGETVHLASPTKDARRDILGAIVEKRLRAAPDVVRDSALNFTALATQTEGYSPTDLQDLVARAMHCAAIRGAERGRNADIEIMLAPEDFTAAQEGFVPLSLRDVQLQKSDVEWCDIGGLNEARRILRETLEWPTKYGPIFAQSPLRLRSGLLLYGYPGCGKTLLASAVAKECGLNFISVKGPELLNKYIGASEKSVRDLFERASAAKPCVLFFDEFDSIAPKRGHDSTGVTDRVVNQMLTQMDGAEGLEGVYVLAATSRPDLIDSALLRPGRLDKSVFCNMPKTDERQEILEALSRKMPLEADVDLKRLAEMTEQFSGADLQALMYNAHLEVVHSTIAHTGDITPSSSTNAQDDEPIEYVQLGTPSGTGIRSRAEESALQKRLKQMMASSEPSRVKESVKKDQTTPKKHQITMEHLNKVLKTTRPSVSFDEQERLRRIYANFIDDRSDSMRVPPSGGGIGQRVTLA